ncbi:MAG TPA: SpoIIE family protein phosphatase [Vicinamibacteria bacterium]
MAARPARPRRGARPAAASRPRALWVGGAARAALGSDLELTSISPEAAPARLRAAPPDLVVLDGVIPSPQLRCLRDALEALDPRPAVLVLVPEGRRLRRQSALRALAEDVVAADTGDAELLGRLRAALRLRRYLSEIAQQSAELDGLRRQIEALAGRMAEDLRLAGNVQRFLMPAPVSHPHLEVAREFLPYREVGGDFYDFLSLGPQRLAVTIGDVMGKGISAALLAASLLAAVRSQLQGAGMSLRDAVSRVNRLFWEVTPPGLFATLFVAVFDLAAGEVEFVNAGHHYPFRVQDGLAVDLVEGGPVLGLMEDAAYSPARLAVRRGDLFVLYSDGVVDRNNEEGEQLGVDRLKQAALHTAGDGARIALYSMLGEVQGWSGGTAPEDDATLIVARIR